MNTESVVAILSASTTLAMDAAFRGQSSYDTQQDPPMYSAFATVLQHKMVAPGVTEDQNLREAVRCAMLRGIDKATVNEVPTEDHANGVATSCAAQFGVLQYKAGAAILKGLAAVYLEAYQGAKKLYARSGNVIDTTTPPPGDPKNVQKASRAAWWWLAGSLAVAGVAYVTLRKGGPLRNPVPVHEQLRAMGVSFDRESFIQGYEDMTWLRDVHFKDIPETVFVGKYKSALLYGGEDSPHTVVLFARRDPDYDDDFVLYRADEDGTLRRVNPITKDYERKGYNQYGASMGRTSDLPYDTTYRLYMQRVPIDDGGYDPGGAYWGIGAPLWLVQSKEDDELNAYVRAPSREAVKKMFPNARWCR